MVARSPEARAVAKEMQLMLRSGDDYVELLGEGLASYYFADLAMAGTFPPIVPTYGTCFAQINNNSRRINNQRIINSLQIINSSQQINSR